MSETLIDDSCAVDEDPHDRRAMLRYLAHR